MRRLGPVGPREVPAALSLRPEQDRGSVAACASHGCAWRVSGVASRVQGVLLEQVGAAVRRDRETLNTPHAPRATQMHA